MEERLKAFCDSLLEHGLPGFDLAAYQDGKCIFRYMNGYSDLEKKVKMSGNERYNIYSCSKVITCTAALQLWEKGLFSLEDRLADYMPEFEHMTVKTENGLEKAKHPILIKHLFEMTAGFSYDTASAQLLQCRKDTDGRCPTREVMRYLAKEPLVSEPGDHWVYSLCHDVLAALVEVISGMKFEEYVKQNIFDVLGMDRSTFMLPESEIDTVCPQYLCENGKPNRIDNHIRGFKIGSEYASGGAGCISTVDDYIRFLEGLRTYRLLKPETLELMKTDRLTAHQKSAYGLASSHGYGLGVRCPNGNPEYTDFGWDGAACAFLAIDMENKLSLYFGAHVLSCPAHEMR
ncbi:MAG: beta-lactamase family protein, partial [Clostridia bacterium]|nr:beta-lactamase family protein [Clostridia bacterium]